MLLALCRTGVCSQMRIYTTRARQYGCCDLETGGPHLIQPETGPDLKSLEVIGWRRRQRQLFAKVVDLDLLGDRLVPVEDLFVEAFKVLAFQIPDEGGLEIVDQFPDSGPKPGVCDHGDQIRVLILSSD